MSALRYIIFLLAMVVTSAAAQQNALEIARKGSVAQARELYAQSPDAFNEKSREGFTPLILATYRGNNEVAQFLIEKGIGIDQNSPMGSPLMAAAVKANIGIAKLLLEKKANPDLTDANGMTALMYAAQFSNSDFVDLLLKHNANRHLKDGKGKTAFEYAVFSGDDKTINLLK